MDKKGWREMGVYWIRGEGRIRGVYWIRGKEKDKGSILDKGEGEG